MQFIKNNNLVPEKEWIFEIENLKTGKFLEDKELIIKKLQEKFISAVEKRIPKKKFGIFFSGGIDSTLIAYVCKKLKKDFVCYSVGLEKSPDLINAKKAAGKLNLNLKIKTYTLKESEKIIKETIEILGKNYSNVVTVGVGSVVLACIKLGIKDKIDEYFSGLGSEEIFAGYQRHEESEDINKECWKGLKTMYTRDFIRDFVISKKYNVKILCPFLDKKLIKLAMQVPAKYKIREDIKKYILRQVAINMQIPKEFALRKKKAAQYGSRFDKALYKLAKKNKFKYKSNYLKHLISEKITIQ